MAGLDHPPRQHGPLPAARKRLRSNFIFAINEASMPMSQISELSGFSHGQRFSNLLHAADGVPVSTAPLFEKVAKLLGYPHDQIFSITYDPSPRLVKRGER